MLLILAAYAFILFKSRLNPKIVRRSAILILTAGTILYYFAYSRETYAEGPLTTFLRSLLSSVKMFIYDADFCEIEEAQRIPMFLDAFMLIFYSAILTSLSAIIMLFGKRAMTAVTLLFRKKKFDHIFLGVNNRSEMIAKGIRDEEIAFIEFPGETDEEAISVSRVLRSISSDSKDGSLLSSRHVTLLRAKHRISHLDSKEGVFVQMGLRRMSKLISPETAFYILSDDENRNLMDILALASDKTLASNTIHACVRREGIVKSYQSVLGKTGAHFIYPASLAVVEMMKNPLCHPASLMDVNQADGTASGEFNALVVGFGETGQASVKFIYEFASAVTSGGEALPVNISVTDSKMESIKGPFIFSCPGMEHDDILSYLNLGLDSSEFWEMLDEDLDRLNLVELSLDNDAANLELACTIYTYAEKKRKNGLDNFRIAVRKQYSPDYELRLVERLNEKAGKDVIILFGEYEKIFTPEMIISKSKNGINKSATSLADKLKTNYESITGLSDNGQSNGTYHEKRRIRQETHQYISRANHVPSKRFIGGEDFASAEKLENLAMVEHLRFSRYLKAHGYTYAPDDDDVLKTNHQLCEWKKLPESDREYHRNMVKASAV